MMEDKKLRPVVALAILVLFVIGLCVAILVGMLYLFDNEARDDAELERLAAENVELNERQIEIQDRQGNLSNEARARIVKNMEVILPALNQTIQSIDEQFDNHTRQVKQHDESLKGAIKILEVPQSNFTAQKIATERIANITNDVQEIKERLINETS